MQKWKSLPEEQRAFGAAVRAFRESAGKSQEDIAELANLHRTYIGGVERGERNISLQNIFKIARSLGITTEELMRQVEALLKDG